MEISVTTKPPRTIREVYDALPEGTLAQLIQSQLVMSPAPTYGHQKLVVRLCNSIYNFLDQNDIGKVIVAPFDVHLDDENVFQPDIIYPGRFGLTGPYGPVPGLDVSGEMVNIEEENVGIAGVPSML